MVPRAPYAHRLAWRYAAAGWRGARPVWALADRVAATPAADVVAMAPDVLVPVRRSDWIAGTAYEGTYERVELRLLPQLLRPGGTFVDVGANYGVYTLRGAALVGSTGRVVAVEPSAACAAWIDGFRPSLPWGNVELVVAALSDEGGGQAELRTPAEHGHDGLATLRAIEGADATATVPVTTLDELDPGGEVDLLKIDVEGWEDHVLRGGQGLLASGRLRALLLEVSPEFADVGRIVDALRPLAADAAFVLQERGGLRRRTHLEPVDLADLVGVARQVNVLVVRPDVAPLLLP
jgi:FkbM family methyltransferase